MLDLCAWPPQPLLVSFSLQYDTATFGVTAAEKEAIACTATKLINPETQIHRKSFVGLMVLTSIEQLPSIEPSEVVLQMISSTQLDRVHRILRWYCFYSHLCIQAASQLHSSHRHAKKLLMLTFQAVDRQCDSDGLC